MLDPLPATSARHSFWAKGAGAFLLVVVADMLLYGAEPGWTLGGFALAWIAVLALAVPAMRRRARLPLAIAALFALLLIEAPGPLAALLCLAAIGSAALLPRCRFDSTPAWAVRLIALGAIGLVAPGRDLIRLSRRPSGRRLDGARHLVLPLVGGGVFLALFAAANPLIGRALGSIAPPSMADIVLHLFFWGLVLLLVWSSLRPRVGGIAAGLPEPAQLPRLPVATLALSLAVFNAIFALENGLDIAFLWSGAPLPAGVTLADYAHQGAYTLIATALLAGGFVAMLLDPASPGGQSRLVRRLVMLWVAQNVVLVASSILRLLDYVAAYSLTELRVAALAWMALVAVGLLLVGWRLIAGRSARWLVNANALAAGLVLTGFCVVDTRAIVADWNVAHAKSSDDLDLCYLGALGPSALPALTDLERRAGGPRLRDAAATLRHYTQARLRETQADWHSWTWRGARQLARADAITGPHPRYPATPRLCTGGLAQGEQPFVD